MYVTVKKAKPHLIPLQDALGVIMNSGTLKVFCPNPECENARGEHTNWGLYIYSGMIDENELQCRKCGATIDIEWNGK